MAVLKAGSRLKSVVCNTEVMVVLAPAAGHRRHVRGCADGGPRRRGARGPALSEDAVGGTQIGKRYVNEAGDLELLCTKPGKGSLGAAGAPLSVKGAKPLPSSD